LSIRSLVKQILTEQFNSVYRRKIRQKQISYAQWIRRLEETSPKADEMIADVHFECYRIHCGEIAEDALNWIAEYFTNHPETDVVYGDEDVMSGGIRQNPWFKPDWSPDFLQSCFYFGGMFAVRKSFLEKHHLQAPANVDTDTKTYFAWGRKCADLAGGYQKAGNCIGHIAKICFHNADDSNYRRYLDSQAETAEMDALQDIPMVSVVIPSKDHPQLLEKCLEHVHSAFGKIPHEVILVDNGSNDLNKKRTEVLVKVWTERGCKVMYLYQPMDFHFSKMCNLGAEKSTGRLLLFLNDDVELCDGSNIEKLVKLACRPYAGAVGIKLYYPESTRIQHAGITNLPMGPVHKLQFMMDERDYYFGTNQKTINVSAVTAAFLLVEKDKFREIGGFSEMLPVAFNDVELCFSLLEKGYYNVCANDCHAYHHESLSRGDDESEEKLNRLLIERGKLYELHPVMQGKDPYYSGFLGRDGLDTGIRGAWETAGNTVQNSDNPIEQFGELLRSREDPCVLVRVESVLDGIIQGYTVVLGDNNACYEKRLLLTDEYGKVYALEADGQYRPDLSANLPDQTNVGLCGFWMIIPQELPKGKYRIGMLVKNRITGVRLHNNTNRYFIKQ
jgi:GT2 family glycosyltransferase